MKLFKNLAVAAAITVCSFASQASVINVGGVTWDPDSMDDLSGFASYIQQFISQTGELSGYGLIQTINDSGPASEGYPQLLVPNGWELTYQFGGFQLAPGFTTPTAGGVDFGYTGGWLKIYVDKTADVGVPKNSPNAFNWTNTGMDADTQLWLSLEAAVNPLTNLTLWGSTSATGAAGTGAFNVVGGLAAGNFDTNTAPYGADVNFNSSFSKFATNFPAECTPAPCNPFSNMYGNANFSGATVPEPSSIAILGLGLLGLAGAARRKQAK